MANKRRRPSPTKIARPIFRYPSTFRTAAETISRVKRSVFLLARGRAVGAQVEWVTLGSGFLCGDSRLMTCGHVIEDPTGHEIAREHRDTDRYILVNHDDEGHLHYYVGGFSRGKTLFPEPDYD